LDKSILKSPANTQGVFSHTRTVVRECCKGDDARQWENGKFDHLPHPKFSHDPSRGFISPYARNCASKCLLGFFIRVLPPAHSLHAWTDFHA